MLSCINECLLNNQDRHRAKVSTRNCGTRLIECDQKANVQLPNASDWSRSSVLLMVTKNESILRRSLGGGGSNIDVKQRTKWSWHMRSCGSERKIRSCQMPSASLKYVDLARMQSVNFTSNRTKSLRHSNMLRIDSNWTRCISININWCNLTNKWSYQTSLTPLFINVVSKTAKKFKRVCIWSSTRCRWYSCVKAVFALLKST